MPNTLNYKEMKNMSSKNGIRIDGKAEAIALLKNSDPAFREKLLQGIRERDPQLAEELSQNFFSFDDIEQLETRDLQKLLMQIPDQMLALALRGMDENFLGKILNSLSQRKAEDIHDYLVNGPRQRMSDVTNARQQIGQIAQMMNEQGQIVIDRSGDSWV